MDQIYIAGCLQGIYNQLVKQRGILCNQNRNRAFIIFSSLVNDDMKRKGEALGADAQLSKPEIGNLVRIVDELVAEKHKAKAKVHSAVVTVP